MRQAQGASLIAETRTRSAHIGQAASCADSDHAQGEPLVLRPLVRPVIVLSLPMHNFYGGKLARP